MRRSLLIFIVSGIMAGLGCAQSSASSSNDSAIRDLVQKYVNARNSRDADATRSLFTKDADQLVSTGEWRKGIDSLIKGAMASSMKETGTSSISVESVRFLERDIAIADGRYETTTTGTSASRKMWTTLVVKRTDGGWRIAAIRNMFPSPNTPPSAH